MLAETREAFLYDKCLGREWMPMVVGTRNKRANLEHDHFRMNKEQAVAVFMQTPATSMFAADPFGL